MMQEEAGRAPHVTEPPLKLCRAPRHEQIAEPEPPPVAAPDSGLRLVAEVAADVVGGSALLALLLATPVILGRLLGLA